MDGNPALKYKGKTTGKYQKNQPLFYGRVKEVVPGHSVLRILSGKMTVTTTIVKKGT
jgi:hypothetical protein